MLVAPQCGRNFILKELCKKIEIKVDREIKRYLNSVNILLVIIAIVGAILVLFM